MIPQLLWPVMLAPAAPQQFAVHAIVHDRMCVLQLQRAERSGAPELQCMQDGRVIVAGDACIAADGRLAARFKDLCREQPELARLGTLLAQQPQAGPPEFEVCLPRQPRVGLVPPWGTGMDGGLAVLASAQLRSARAV